MKLLDKTKNSGITLIALVITVVILIILAGVVINLTIGENGIFSKAKYARDKYLNEESLEQQQLNELYAYLVAEDLPENTKDTDAGTIVRLPDEWKSVTPNYISTNDGNIVTKSTKVASVYAVSTGNGETVPVPVGFWYVGGTLNNGIVISDDENDKNAYAGQEDVPSGIKIENGEIKYELKGNQFVWIPWTKEEYVKSNWANGSQGNVTGISNCYWDTTTNSSELLQIEKYGGFYVGRYESGLPKNTAEFTGSLERQNDVYNISGIPQIKAGIIPWNYINWNNAQTNSQKMYEGKNNILTGLITGTQWDVMLNKIGSLKDENGNIKYSLTDSKSWGNYYEGEAFSFIGRAAEYKTSDLKLYQFGELIENGNKANKTYYLLTTGASEHNKAYNLYDVAGNLWEWTEESASRYVSSTLTVNPTYRGGSFWNESYKWASCFRSGDFSMTNCFASLGFRVVLYMK